MKYYCFNCGMALQPEGYKRWFCKNGCGKSWGVITDICVYQINNNGRFKTCKRKTTHLCRVGDTVYSRCELHHNIGQWDSIQTLIQTALY